MLNQIVHFLLELAAGLIGGACLLRAYMQAQHVSFGNPIGRFVLAITDWLVLPLRRGLPKGARWDLASLLAAWLVKLAQFTLVWLLAGRMLVGWGWGPVLASFGLVQMAISGLSALLILYAVLSWVQPGGGSPLAYVVERLCAPLLAPFRKVMPLVGGVDLSPLALLVLLQIAAIVLADLQHMVMGMGAVLVG
jgi:YggT family protein